MRSIHYFIILIGVLLVTACAKNPLEYDFKPMHEPMYNFTQSSKLLSCVGKKIDALDGDPLDIYVSSIPDHTTPSIEGGFLTKDAVMMVTTAVDRLDTSRATVVGDGGGLEGRRQVQIFGAFTELNRTTQSNALSGDVALNDWTLEFGKDKNINHIAIDLAMSEDGRIVPKTPTSVSIFIHGERGDAEIAFDNDGSFATALAYGYTGQEGFHSASRLLIETSVAVMMSSFYKIDITQCLNKTKNVDAKVQETSYDEPVFEDIVDEAGGDAEGSRKSKKGWSVVDPKKEKAQLPKRETYQDTLQEQKPSQALEKKVDEPVKMASSIKTAAKVPEKQQVSKAEVVDTSDARQDKSHIDTKPDKDDATAGQSMQGVVLTPPAKVENKTVIKEQKETPAHYKDIPQMPRGETYKRPDRNITTINRENVLSTFEQNSGQKVYNVPQRRVTRDAYGRLIVKTTSVDQIPVEPKEYKSEQLQRTQFQDEYDDRVATQRRSTSIIDVQNKADAQALLARADINAPDIQIGQTKDQNVRRYVWRNNSISGAFMKFEMLADTRFYEYAQHYVNNSYDSCGAALPKRVEGSNYGLLKNMSYTSFDVYCPDKTGGTYVIYLYNNNLHIISIKRLKPQVRLGPIKDKLLQTILGAQAN